MPLTASLLSGVIGAITRIDSLVDPTIGRACRR
jgi:hypothetical protein